MREVADGYGHAHYVDAICVDQQCHLLVGQLQQLVQDLVLQQLVDTKLEEVQWIQQSKLKLAVLIRDGDLRLLQHSLAVRHGSENAVDGHFRLFQAKLVLVC